MRTIFITLVAVFTLVLGWSQSPVAFNRENVFNEWGDFNWGFRPIKHADSRVIGDRFLFAAFTNGNIVTKDQKKYNIAGLNYDAQLDQIVMKISADSVFVFNPANIAEVTINNKVFRRYLDPEYQRNSFYEVIGETSDVQFLKRNTAVVKDGFYNPMTKEKLSPDSFIMKHDYFIQKDGELHKVKLRKKLFMELFENKANEVDDYVSKSGLSYKNDSDISEIVKYYLTL